MDKISMLISCCAIFKPNYRCLSREYCAIPIFWALGYDGSPGSFTIPKMVPRHAGGKNKLLLPYRDSSLEPTINVNNQCLGFVTVMF